MRLARGLVELHCRGGDELRVAESNDSYRLLDELLCIVDKLPASFIQGLAHAIHGEDQKWENSPLLRESLRARSNEALEAPDRIRKDAPNLSALLETAVEQNLPLEYSDRNDSPWWSRTGVIAIVLLAVTILRVVCVDGDSDTEKTVQSPSADGQTSGSKLGSSNSTPRDPRLLATAKAVDAICLHGTESLGQGRICKVARRASRAIRSGPCYDVQSGVSAFVKEIQKLSVWPERWNVPGFPRSRAVMIELLALAVRIFFWRR